MSSGKVLHLHRVRFWYCPKHPMQRRVWLWGRFRCPICAREYARTSAQKQHLKQYGLTPQARACMGHTCQICGRCGNDVVDHDHKTGRVRGVLCRDCNLALGFFRDDPRKLEQAIRYLGGNPCAA